MPVLNSGRKPKLGLQQSEDGLKEAPQSSALLVLKTRVSLCFFPAPSLPVAILEVILFSWLDKGLT